MLRLYSSLNAATTWEARGRKRSNFRNHSPAKPLVSIESWPKTATCGFRSAEFTKLSRMTPPRSTTLTCCWTTRDTSWPSTASCTCSTSSRRSSSSASRRWCVRAASSSHRWTRRSAR
uniref:(northern house mosquito) hypothetical protein n=1 Tax=Culex pipiens TaxID=7175 RepID=A0A8D8FSF7_CULPI